MKRRGLRAISYQVTRKVEKATNLRIPLKPLMAILCIIRSFIFCFIKSNPYLLETVSIY